MKILLLTILLLSFTQLHAKNITELQSFNTPKPDKKLFYKNSSFKAVSISLDKNEILPEHKVPFQALLLCTKGTAKYFSGTKEITLKNGDYYSIKKDSMHKIVATSNAQFLLIRP